MPLQLLQVQQQILLIQKALGSHQEQILTKHQPLEILDMLLQRLQVHQQILPTQIQKYQMLTMQQPMAIIKTTAIRTLVTFVLSSTTLLSPMDYTTMIGGMILSQSMLLTASLITL